MAKVRFSLDAPGARKVFLAGDFTDWQASPLTMRRRKAGTGTFSTSVALSPGAYQYKFIVDGAWIEDPRAERVPNPFGTSNSVIKVAR